MLWLLALLGLRAAEVMVSEEIRPVVEREYEDDDEYALLSRFR